MPSAWKKKKTRTHAREASTTIMERECCLWGKAFGFYLMQWEATGAYKTGSETKILFGAVHEH